MGTILRILLIVGAVLLVAHVLTNIKKSRIQIEDSLFWVSFVGLIIIIAVFPAIMTWVAGLFGFVSTSNFVFLVVVGILLLKVFTSSVEISRLKFRVNQLAQEVALTNKRNFDRQQLEQNADTPAARQTASAESSAQADAPHEHTNEGAQAPQSTMQ